MKDKPESSLRELFIEELERVQGGTADPLSKIKDWLQTTHGFCEEGHDPTC